MTALAAYLAPGILLALIATQRHVRWRMSFRMGLLVLAYVVLLWPLVVASVITAWRRGQ